MLILALVLRRALPLARPPENLAYPQLLRSILTLVREEPILRRRMLFGALSMAGFNIVWTSLAFLLSGPPYGYSEAVIGLFALAGLAGAGAASYFGRLADIGPCARGDRRRLGRRARRLGLPRPRRALGAGVIAGLIWLDLGVQAMQILNQSTIYQLRPEARSRLTTAYITAYFFGAVSGSALASLAWSEGGWGAITALGGAVAALGLVAWLALD